MTNAWLLYRKSHPHEKTVSQLIFRREIMKILLVRCGMPPKTAGRIPQSMPSVSFKRVADEIRYDNIGYFMIELLNGERRRCAGEGCSLNICLCVISVKLVFLHLVSNYFTLVLTNFFSRQCLIQVINTSILPVVGRYHC